MQRIALIGLGSMGRKYARMLADGKVPSMRLSAVVARGEGSVRFSREELKDGVRIFSSAEQLFDEGRELFDAVLIVTPHKTHPQLAKMAFECKKHVFMDKPMGISVSECRELGEIALRENRKFAIMFHQRRYPKYIRIKQLLDSGMLGSIERIMLENSRYFRTRAYHESSAWRSSWSGEGGGALINQGQHILDIWQWLFGMPSSIRAMIPFGKYNDFSVDDEATLFMEYPDKRTAVFILSTGEAGRTERLEICGTRGRITMTDDELSITSFSEDSREYQEHSNETERQGLSETVHREHLPLSEEPYIEMLSNFGASIENGTALFAEGESGISALELTNAAYLSAWLDKKIELPIDGELYREELEKRMLEERKNKNGTV